MTSIEQKIEESVFTMGKYQLRFEHKDFGPDFVIKAATELRETEENIHDAIEALRNYLLDEKNLEFPVKDEDALKIFLRPCKYYPDSTFQKMKRYYKFRLKHPKYFKDLLPSVEKAAFMQNLLTILPMRNHNGERILVVEAGRKWNTKSCTVINILRAVFLVLEAAIAEPRTQVAGAHLILDMEGLSLQHVWQFTPGFASDVATFVQDCVPLRLKGVHIVNQPYIFNMLFAIFKPFLGEKLRNRIHFHGTNFTSSLHHHLDKEILPLKYDGLADIPLDLGEKLHFYLTNFEAELRDKTREGYISEQN